MKTNKPFSFISYNSTDFLKNILNSSVECGDFTRCACWYHESLGEEKTHYHCWIEPAKMIKETSDLKSRFIEMDEDGQQQSIAIKPNCSSKFNDAYLYGIHDSDYLEAKGKVRELVNIVSDKHIYIGDFKADIAEAEVYKFKSVLAPYQKLKYLVYQGLTLEEVYTKLRTPFAQLSVVGTIYHIIEKEYNKMLQREEIEYQRRLKQEEKEERQILIDIWNKEDENK